MTVWLKLSLWLITINKLTRTSVFVTCDESEVEDCFDSGAFKIVGAEIDKNQVSIGTS